MSVINDYLATVGPEERALFEHMRSVAMRIVPSAEEGVSYGMPALKYKDKAFLSFHAGKEFLSIYPFSGKTIAALEERLRDFECTTGSIHFSLERPLPDDLLEAVLTTRLAEIEAAK